MTSSVLVHSIKCWYTKSFSVSTTYQMTWSFWCNHEDINVFRSFDVTKVDVETMSKSDSFSSAQVWSNFIFVDIFLDFIRCQDHDDICQFSCFCYWISFKTIFFCFIEWFTRTHTDDDIMTWITQVLCVGMALWTITDHGDFLAV